MIPELSHLATNDHEDFEEIKRLLVLVFRDDAAAAERWLRDRDNGVFGCSPLEMLQRDMLGVVRVISYLNQAAP